MDQVGRFTQIPFSKNRELVIDVLELGRLKNHVSGFIEADVTLAREYIGKYKEKTGDRISFTGWIVKCIGLAVHENPQIHAMRNGKKNIIIFDEIDILVTIEKQICDDIIPLPYVIRKANLKSLLEISDEIRKGQEIDQNNKGMIIGQDGLFLSIYQYTPKFIRKIIGRRLIKDPFYIKKNVGTVGISSIGMMGSFHGWVLPVSPQPLYFALGSIDKKPGVINGRIEICDKLSISFLFDHDVIDGAPVARFIDRLTSLIESAYALNELITSSD